LISYYEIEGSLAGRRVPRATPSIGVPRRHRRTSRHSRRGRGRGRGAAPYHRPVTKPPPNPLDGTDRLLVDGNNLLHAASRGSGRLPQAALIGRLRGVIPAEVGIEIVFDGPADPGLRGERIASGLIVRHGGRWTADRVLLSLVDEARATSGGRRESVENILVVTDDRELRLALTAKGARTARSAWLLNRLERGRLEASAIGNRRPPAPSRGPDDGQDQDARAGWRPGRGATAKRGNPKRGHPPRAR